MISGMSSWAQNIVVSVIIVTILEMILQEGNIKKYIKTVMGIYIVFVIISPIIGKTFLEDFNVEDFFKEDSKEVSSVALDNDAYISSIYKSSLTEDIVKRLKEKGYKADVTSIELETYEKIKSVELKISKQDNNIKPIEINTKTEKSTLEKEEIDEIKQYIKDTYEISMDNIIIKED